MVWNVQEIIFARKCVPEISREKECLLLNFPMDFINPDRMNHDLSLFLLAGDGDSLDFLKIDSFFGVAPMTVNRT
jgi:hypothetical protein